MPPFPPGQSGNPKGRPKGARSVAKAFLEEIAQAAPLPAGKKGAAETSKLKAIVRKQIDKGIDGDNRAIEAVLDRMDSLEKEVRASHGPSFTSADREVIEEIHRRLAPSRAPSVSLRSPPPPLKRGRSHDETGSSRVSECETGEVDCDAQAAQDGGGK